MQKAPARRRRRRNAGAPRAFDAFPIPADLRVTRIARGSDEFMILSYPIPPKRATGSAFDRLSSAEKAVALLVLRGLRNSEIARARSTAPRTIANQVAAIYRKLGIGSRSELAAQLDLELGSPLGTPRTAGARMRRAMIRH